MKGLLLKDYYLTKKYCRAFLLLLLVFLGISIVGGKENAFFLMYPSIIISMLPMTLYSYDERERWCVYSQTFPVSKTEYVSAKYIFGFIANSIVYIITAVIEAVKTVRSGSFAADEYFAVMACTFSVGMLAAAILLPCIFKCGSEKGRYVYYILIVAACTSSVILTNMKNFISDTGMTIGSAALCIAAVILWCISWKLSVVFYNKREI